MTYVACGPIRTFGGVAGAAAALADAARRYLARGLPIGGPCPRPGCPECLLAGELQRTTHGLLPARPGLDTAGIAARSDRARPVACAVVTCAEEAARVLLRSGGDPPLMLWLWPSAPASLGDPRRILTHGDGAGDFAVCALLCGSGRLPPCSYLSACPSDLSLLWDARRRAGATGFEAALRGGPAEGLIAFLTLLASGEDAEFKRRDAKMKSERLRRGWPPRISDDEVAPGVAGWRQRYYASVFGTTHMCDIPTICSMYLGELGREAERAQREREQPGPSPDPCGYPFSHGPTLWDLALVCRSAGCSHATPQGTAHTQTGARAPSGYLRLTE
jgi:hypothetical protein